MSTKTYIGTVKIDKYGLRTDNGYEPALELDCENGETLNLGNTEQASPFKSLVGTRIKLTIEELEPINDQE